MTPERWRRVDELFHSALEREPAGRAAFLAEACAGDEALLREVETLIAAHEKDGSFIDSPAYADAGLLVDDQATLTAGQRLGPYEVISHIGSGGMGEVYLAEDTRLGRKVALKLLPPEFTGDEDRLRRFRQEARTASALNHPNILTIYEIGSEGGAHFMATEYVEGETLRRHMAGGALKPGEALDVGIQVASALAAAHAAGIVHRDVKPENVMVRRDGFVKVLDFGLAKLAEPAAAAGSGAGTAAARVGTNPGIVMGTPHYMSPEQARGLGVDARTDIFSLGAVLYEMVGGRAPFEGETPSDVLVSLLDKEPAPLSRYLPGVPAELQRIVDKSLCKDREGRYRVVKDLLIDLESLQDELAFEAKLERSVYSLRSGRETINSIAVMPFINVSGDPNTEYLSEGISESVSYSLSHLPNLKVMASSMVFRYKGRQTDARTVGRELGVSAVLTGKVVQRGDGLTVSAELVDARDNRLLWGRQYNRKVSDSYAIQEEISRQVSDTLRLQMTAEDQKRLSKRQTESTEAYQAYLKGRYYWNKRTQEAAKKGIEHFQEAIDLDPNYALAYAGIADSYIILGVYSSLPSAEAFTKAKAMALRALEIDDALAEAHTSLAYVRFRREWDWSGAEEEYRRAIELNPNYATAYQWAALNLAAMGRLDEAIAEMKRAEAIDPLSLIINSNMEWVLYLARRNDDAIAHCRKTLQIDPSFFATHKYLGLMYVQRGMYDQAITAYQKARDLSADDPHIISLVGHAYALARRREKALEALDNLEELSNRRYVSPYSIALIYTGLGEKDQAFAWLEKAYHDRSGLMVYLKVEPMLDSLRSDTRFAELVHRIGLPT